MAHGVYLVFTCAQKLKKSSSCQQLCITEILLLLQLRLDRGLHPYHVVSWSIQPFDHNRHGPKSRAGLLCLFPWGDLGLTILHNTVYVGLRITDGIIVAC